MRKATGQKDADVARRDANIAGAKRSSFQGTEAIDDRVGQKVKLERGNIAVEEAKKAELILQKKLKKTCKHLLNSRKLPISRT